MHQQRGVANLEIGRRPLRFFGMHRAAVGLMAGQALVQDNYSALHFQGQ